MALNEFDVSKASEDLLKSSPANVLDETFPFDTSINTSLSGSLWRKENIFGSYFADKELQQRVSSFSPDPDFKYGDNIPPDLMEYRDRFVTATSIEKSQAIASQLRRELNDGQNIANHPIKSLFLGFVIGNADPTLLMPGGAICKSVKAGSRIAKSAFSLGVATAAQATVQETALRYTQQTRELDESVYNVLAATLLGSVLGGIGGAVLGGPIGKKAKADIASAYADGLGPPHTEDLSAAKIDPEYLAESSKLAGLGNFIGKLAQNLTPMTRMMYSPFQTARAFSDMAYDTNIIKKGNLPEHGNNLKADNLEIKIRLGYSQLDSVMVDYEDIFFRQAGIEKGPAKRLRSLLPSEGLGFEQFDSAVTTAMRNGDRHENPHVQEAAQLLRKKVFDPLKDRAIEMGLLPKNVDVKTATSYFMRVHNKQKIKENPDVYKATVLRPYFTAKNEELKGLQPTIVDLRNRVSVAKANFTRAKNTQSEIDRLLKKKKQTADDKIRLRELQKRLKPDEAEAILKNIEKELDETIPFDLKDSDGNIRRVLEDDQIEIVIDQTVANILGRNEAKLLNPMMQKFIGKGKTKPLHNRVFLIPDEMIEDWTINSASKISELYGKAMIPTLEMHEFARRTNVPAKRQKSIQSKLIKRDELEAQRIGADDQTIREIDVEIAKINDEITLLESPPTPQDALGQILVDLEDELNHLKRGKSPKENAELEKKFDSAVKDITATFDLLQGVYGIGPNIIDNQAATVFKNIKTWNFIRLMGFMMLSSLPDIAMHIMRHGPMSFMREGLIPVLRMLEGAKMNKSMLQDMGRGIETLKGQRIKSFIDHEGTALETGLFGKALEFVSDTFGNASLMNQWQDFNQTIAGNMSMSRTLRSIDTWMKTGKMGRKDKIRFNLLRLNEEDWKVIHQEWKKTGGIDNGSYYCNWGDWDTSNPTVAKAYQKFREATLSEVDSTVVIPGLGDKPLASHQLILSPMFQFKSFMLAATNKTLTAGLSRNDAEFYMGVCSALAMGAMGYVISAKIRRPNEEVDLSWEKLTKEAVDRSGVLGVFMEGFNMAEKLLGNNGVSRYQNRGFSGTFLGPTAGLAEDIAYLINKMSRSISDDNIQMTTKDAEKFMRLAPYQNLFYLYYLNRQVTKQAALGLGFEDVD